MFCASRGYTSRIQDQYVYRFAIQCILYILHRFVAISMACTQFVAFFCLLRSGRHYQSVFRMLPGKSQTRSAVRSRHQNRCYFFSFVAPVEHLSMNSVLKPLDILRKRLAPRFVFGCVFSLFVIRQRVSNMCTTSANHADNLFTNFLYCSRWSSTLRFS